MRTCVPEHPTGPASHVTPHTTLTACLTPTPHAALWHGPHFAHHKSRIPRPAPQSTPFALSTPAPIPPGMHSPPPRDGRYHPKPLPVTPEHGQQLSAGLTPYFAADFFNARTRIYSFDPLSWYNVFAALCGAEVIVVPVRGVTATSFRSLSPYYKSLPLSSPMPITHFHGAWALCCAQGSAACEGPGVGSGKKGQHWPANATTPPPPISLRSGSPPSVWEALVSTSAIPGMWQNPSPPGEDQTNNRGELRAVLSTLQGHVRGTPLLICPDSTFVVHGMLGRAYRWRSHKWQTQSGPVQHVDLWTQVLELLDVIGSEVQWLHIPSHTGINRE